MPTFHYSARDQQGVPQRGTSSAGSAESLAAELRGRGLLVLRVQLVAQDARRTARSLNPLSWLPPTAFDIELGFLQMATMLESGLTLLSALRTVGEQSRRPRAAALWRDIAERIERGETLSGALGSHRRFPDYIIQLVRVGEHSGELDRMLTRAAEHLEQTRNLRAMLANALAYPVIVVLATLGVSAYMTLTVIPKISRYLATTGHALPPITQTMMDVSHALRAGLPALSIGALAAAVALFAVRRWPPGRRATDACCLRIPVVGSILRLTGSAVFARGLGVLLESGITLLESLRTVENLIGNRALAARVRAARVAVTQGESLASALAGSREFLPMLPHMIAVGESTGVLGQTMGRVARFFEAQIMATIRRLGIVIEPVMVVVVGGIVGFVYAAFFVALFSLATGVR